jgi:hypothetical protein
MRLLAQSSTVSRAGRGAQPRTFRAFSLVCRISGKASQSALRLMNSSDAISGLDIPFPTR